MSEYPIIFNKQVCPCCGKDDVAEGSHVEITGDTAWQIVTCNCGFQYVEVYKYYRTEVYDAIWKAELREYWLKEEA